MDNLTGTARILWQGKYLIVLGLAVGTIGAIIASKASARVYESNTLMQVQAELPSTGTEVLGLQQASQGLAITYATLINSGSFMSRIRGQVAGGRYSTADLAFNVNAAAITQGGQTTNLVRVTATGASPLIAYRLAGDVTQAFLRTINQDAERRAKQQQSQLQSRISGLTNQIDQLSLGSSAGLSATKEQIGALRAARQALSAEMASAIATAVSQEGSATLVGPPTQSSAPIRPRPRLDLLIGIMLGLMGGVGLAWLRSLLDRRVDSAEEVGQLIDVPVLASIPLRRNQAPGDLVTREAYDVLRTNLNFLALDGPLRVLTVTSYESGEGKTTTAEELAYAAARRELKVLLVDGDLRTRALSTRLGADQRRGLVNVVANSSAYLGGPSDRGLLSLCRELGPGVSLLPAGPQPPNPPSVLASAKMRKAVQQLRERYDLVIFDAPPTAHLADAAILAGLSDASILVVRIGQTQKSHLVAAAAALQRTPTPIVGAVVFERRPIDTAYYPAGAGLSVEPVPTPSAGRRRTRQDRGGQAVG